MIAIIDYGMGNLKSLSNAMNKLDIDFFFLDNAKSSKPFTHIIVPGVGSYPVAMKEIKKRGLVDFIFNQRKYNTPILGICLGMQIFSYKGSEGNRLSEGLKFIDGTVENISELEPLNRCHVGWNSIKIIKNSKIFENIKNDTHFYFDHSYFFKNKSSDNILCETKYKKTFSSGVIENNLIGLQFHPEKSHDKGLIILKNFYKNFNA